MDRNDLRALAAARRKAALADLRDGRRRRAHRIESGKRYKRKNKHKDKYDG